MNNLKLILICFLITTYSFAGVSPEEKEALVALYNATNGDNWNTTWNINGTVDSWHGVKVESDKVTEINLQFNNLEGQLPEEVGNLVHLKNLNLGFNKLSGNLPSSIKKLKDLRALELFMNRFEGQIPSGLGELKQLESLKLYSNQFTGEIPQ